MTTFQLTRKIEQLAAITHNIRLKQAEADWLRDNVAQELLKRDEKKFNGCTAYKVSEHEVRKHVRQSYVAVRIK